MLTFLILVQLLMLIGGKIFMADLSALTARVDSFVTLVAGIQSDYENLKARIDELEGQIDPEIQAKIDAEVAKLDARFSELTALDESFPVVEPSPEG